MVVRLPIRSLLAFAGFSLLAANVCAQEIYCWDDESGFRHCGDSVPPDEARHDREVLNEQGIRIRSEEGEITPEEQAEIDRLNREEEARLREREESRRYDRMLIDTYLRVEDIENLRDRRLELIDSQIRVTEIYLRNLNRKLDGLKRDAGRFAPYNNREGASPIPENLSLDIDRTESSIEVREQALSEIRDNQIQTTLEFQRDIERFRELKGLSVRASRDSSTG